MSGALHVVSLASGSKGNAYCVTASDGATLLVDCGLSGRELKRRAAAAGVDTASFVGVVVTHNHTDHVSGLEAFHKCFPEVPLFANLMTAEATAEATGVDQDAFACFENGQPFDVGPFAVSAFSIPHDTCDPVGYLVSADGMTYFHGTDIGTPLDAIGVHLAEADVATLESNHDSVMLRTSGRPLSLIQRIAGPRGHLSNDESAGLVRRFAAPKLKFLALAHLSHDCNAPHMAEKAMRAALAAAGRADVALTVLSQDEPRVVAP